MEGNTIYLNGTYLCGTESVFHDTENTDKTLSTRSISWGAWKNFETDKIKTGGLTTSVICGIIVLKVGWCPAGIAATVAGITAGKYDVLSTKGRIRYGRDSRYQYYQRETKFYGDGKLIYGPFTDKGKTPLNGTGSRSL